MEYSAEVSFVFTIILNHSKLQKMEITIYQEM